MLPKGKWDFIFWVKDYNEFKNFLENSGIPTAISFDHDLHPEHYTPQKYWDDYAASKKYQEVARKKYKHLTGQDCAEYLRDYCMTSDNQEFPMCFIHSQNPVGADWIQETLRDYVFI